MYPTDRLYSQDHEWVQFEGNVCTVGITAYAQDELGEVVFVELPEVGDTYEAAEEIGTIESVKAVAEVYTPVSGEILEVNQTLENEPQLVNDSPYDKGWLVKLKLAGEADTGDLMDSAGYQEFVEAEAS